MKSISVKDRIFRSSTALAVTLALSVSSNSIAFAQQDETTPSADCAADQADAACLDAVAEEPLPETLLSEEPVLDEAVTETLTEEPVVEADAATEVEPEETQAEIEASVEMEIEGQAERPEESSTENSATNEVTTEDVPTEDALIVESPESDAAATGEETIAEEPAPQPETAVDQPSEDLATEEPTTESQSAEGEEPEQAPTPESAAADETSPSEPIPAESAAPATIVADDTTADQSAQIEADEQRRREEARERRNELLGAAAVGAVVGALIPALGGTIVEDQGDRLIVERDGNYFVRRDENSLLRDGDAEVRIERLGNGRTQETVTRANGVEIITIRDQGGYVLYRSRIMPSGREFVLIDNREIDDRAYVDFNTVLPPIQLGIPQDRYILPARLAGYDDIYQTFTAPPVQQVQQTFTLRQVRESERLRDLVRRVDLDTITFETGQATIRQNQVPALKDIALAAVALVEQNPSTVLLVEGHTDAIGSDINNLALSDRRAETVARILVDIYDVPPENLIVQGYGEQHLKVQTQAADERNRRVTLRNITPLLGS